MDEDGISELRAELMAVLCTEVRVTFADGDAGETLVEDKLLEGKNGVDERTNTVVELPVAILANKRHKNNE